MSIYFFPIGQAPFSFSSSSLGQIEDKIAVNAIRVARIVIRESPNFVIPRIMMYGNILKKLSTGRTFFSGLADTGKLLFNLLPCVGNFPCLIEGAYGLSTGREMFSGKKAEKWEFGLTLGAGLFGFGADLISLICFLKSGKNVSLKTFFPVFGRFVFQETVKIFDPRTEIKRLKDLLRPSHPTLSRDKSALLDEITDPSPITISTENSPKRPAWITAVTEDTPPSSKGMEGTLTRVEPEKMTLLTPDGKEVSVHGNLVPFSEGDRVVIHLGVGGGSSTTKQLTADAAKDFRSLTINKIDAKIQSLEKLNDVSDSVREELTLLRSLKEASLIEQFTLLETLTAFYARRLAKQGKTGIPFVEEVREALVATIQRENLYSKFLTREKDGTAYFRHLSEKELPSTLKLRDGKELPDIIFLWPNDRPINFVTVSAYFRLGDLRFFQEHVSGNQVNFYRDQIRRGQKFRSPITLKRDYRDSTLVIDMGNHRSYAAFSEDATHIQGFVSRDAYSGNHHSVDKIRIVSEEEYRAISASQGGVMNDIDRGGFQD